MYRSSAADLLVLQGFCANPGIPPQMPQKGGYTHSVNFLRLSNMQKIVLFGGCFSGVVGGLLRKTAVSRAMSGSRVENTCCCSYCYRSTENGDLARTAKAQQLWKIYCHKRDTNLSWNWICVVYHVLRRYTRGDNEVYLHRAAPWAMGHRRRVEGYDRASSTV